MKRHFIKITLFVLVVSVVFGSFLAFAQPAQTTAGQDQKESVQQTGSKNQAPGKSATDNSILYLAAALAVGFSSIAAGWAVSTVGSAALGAISEKPELAGRALIFVGLAEGIAIYGLIIAIMLIGKAG
ncbi:MAG TPA: ATP synthase subunit C [Spirochaetota bacterium]|nr:ATP synthase subunit C [Spirochaetota bacterium]HPH03862.1 ATP synthase subunit C [Spirochaetota bacterium]HPN83012.1 ATP synthase subunit C [Spirochaetota bacterium]